MRPIWNGYCCARKRLFFHRIGSFLTFAAPVPKVGCAEILLKKSVAWLSTL